MAVEVSTPGGAKVVEVKQGNSVEVSQARQPLSGLSAYEIAVLNGFEGTEQEWLASLSSGGLTISTREGNILELENGALFVPEPELSSRQW